MRRWNLAKTALLSVHIALAGSVLSIAQEAPPAAVICFSLALLASVLAERRPLLTRTLKPLWIVPAALVGIFFSFAGIGEENLMSRLLSILLILVSVKLLLPKRPRDLLQLYLLNLLAVAAAAVTRWGLEFGLLALIETFLSITGLAMIYGSQEEMEVSRIQMGHLLRATGLITLLLIPVAAVLFVLIPRPVGMFFSWGVRSAARSGFGDRVAPGSVSEIKTDPTPAFRVRWIKGNLPVRPLWRGAVYDTYMDGAWIKRFHSQVPFAEWEDASTVQYEVLLEPVDQRSLPGYGLPIDVRLRPHRPFVVNGYTLQSPDAIHNRILYQVSAYAVADFPEDMPPESYLGIPRSLRDPLGNFARPMEKRDAFQTAAGVEAFLRGGFEYTLSPGEARGDPVLHFLTITRKGHCEYFASAMTLLLRSLGIPARVVGGYAGGEWNELGRYFLVRQSDAHTWVEAWIQDRGWVAFDPTPAALLVEGTSLRSRLVRMLDLMAYRWYYWVIDYDLSKQVDLARRAASWLRSFRSGEFQIRIPGSLSRLPELREFWPYPASAVLVFLLWVAWRLYRHRPRGWGERFSRLLEGHGLNRGMGDTPLEWAGRITTDHPAVGQKALAFVRSYYLLEYGGRGQEEELARLFAELREELRACQNSERGTRNAEVGTRKSERGSRNGEVGTRKSERGSRSAEPGTGNDETTEIGASEPGKR
ncbi:MAG: transglutaminaseTgpA domain-containing protein [Thermodesulfobacteriota bacterium]